MPRFPTRTLVLMVLALAAFGWFFFQTHARVEPSAAARGSITEVKILSPEVQRDH